MPGSAAYSSLMRNGPLATYYHLLGDSLAQVRHGEGRKSAKPFRISSGYGRVYTTFSIEFEALGEADAELAENRFLFSRGFGDTAETNLTTVRSGKDNVGALQGGEQSEDLHR